MRGSFLICSELTQGFSALALLTFRAREFVVGDHLAHCRMFSIILALHPLGDSSTLISTQFQQPQMSLDFAKDPLGDKIDRGRVRITDIN